MRLYNKDQDYFTLCDWWIAQKWQNIPTPKQLPKIGLIVDDVCAAFLYQSDSSIAWVAFPVSNPYSDKEVRNAALNAVIVQLENIAKESGFDQIFTTSNIPKLIERYKALGFVEGDKDTLHLVKVI